MTFSAKELSLAQGRPVRLYRFNRGVLTWLYTSADRDVTYQQGVYRTLAGGITDNGIRMTGDPQSEALEITAPADINVAQQWRGVPPSDRLGLSVFDMHYGDEEARLSWVGSISTVNWPSLDRCRISCASRNADMDEPGLVLAFTRGCGAVLGDMRCGVDMNSLRVEALIQSSDGASVYSSNVETFPAGWFTAGWVEWPVGTGEFNRRHIELHQGSQLRLLGGTVGMPTGGSLRVYPGCDFLYSTCRDKFGNSDNFRGVPNLQMRSPFDGNQVF